MTWEEVDWPALERLRATFLRSSAVAESYWETPGDLASYDFTYGERIGWKWDHVLRELRLRGWRPHSRHVFDWGCGSGVAARRVIGCFGAENFDELTVWDHSPLACDFAEATATRAFPTVRTAQATPGLLASSDPVGLLVVSHVLNELPPEALASLRALAARAEEIIWVEPGTHQVGRALSRLREELRPTFQLVAPCTHQEPCPVLAPDHERHWCHHFAPPPAGIFADSQWVKFGHRAGIDLRSLPYSFLVLTRTAAPRLENCSRIIGRPAHFKAYARVLNCDASGLAELELPKRADPALYKQLERTKAPLVYRWRRDGAKLLGGEPLNPPAAEGETVALDSTPTL